MTLALDDPKFLVRFLSKVDKTEGCWLWTAGYDPTTGYGKCWVGAPAEKRGQRLAHRVSYELHRGAIPEGLLIDHLCRVKRCVRPDHLEPVTHRENMARGNSGWAVNARTGKCHRGHPLEGDSLKIEGGKRRCLKCRRIARSGGAR